MSDTAHIRYVGIANLARAQTQAHITKNCTHGDASHPSPLPLFVRRVAYGNRRRLTRRCVLQVERLEREHVADSRRMRQMEDAAVKAQSRLKTSERQVAEQSQRYQVVHRSGGRGGGGGVGRKGHGWDYQEGPGSKRRSPRLLSVARRARRASRVQRGAREKCVRGQASWSVMRQSRSGSVSNAVLCRACKTPPGW